MTAPIAVGESSIAPSTDSSASRFCGGTCGDCAGRGASSVGDLGPWLSPLQAAAADGLNGWGSTGGCGKLRDARFAGGREHVFPRSSTGRTAALPASSTGSLARFCRRSGKFAARSTGLWSALWTSRRLLGRPAGCSVAAARQARLGLGSAAGLDLGLRRAGLVVSPRPPPRPRVGCSAPSGSSSAARPRVAAAASARCASASACAAACSSASAASIAASSSSGGSSPPSGTTRIFTSAVTSSKTWIGTA